MTRAAPKIKLSADENQSTTLRLIDNLSDFESLQEEWDALYDECDRNRVFTSWDWMFTWWEVYKDQFDRELFILCFYKDEKLVGIAPFQICNPPFPKTLVQGKTLQFIGNGEAFHDTIVSESQDLIVKSGLESEIVTLVSAYLNENKKKWNFADFEFLLKDALILRCLTDSHHAQHFSRYKMEYGVRFFIPQHNNFDEYQAKMKSRWRKKFNKQSRRIERVAEVRTESTEDLSSITPALSQLAEMNCSRWREITGNCIFDSSRFVDFHQKVMERLVPKKRAAIKTLYLGDEALASYYIFSDKNHIHYYQSGFFTKYANKYSPLFLLVCNEIGSALNKGQSFDFMFAEDANSYKKEQYACEHEPMYRLRWSSQKYRLPLFHFAKYVQNKTLHIKKVVTEKPRKKRGK